MSKEIINQVGINRYYELFSDCEENVLQSLKTKFKNVTFAVDSIEAFLNNAKAKIMAKLSTPEYESRDFCSGYLYTICTNEIYNFIKRKKQFAPIDDNCNYISDTEEQIGLQPLPADFVSFLKNKDFTPQSCINFNERFLESHKFNINDSLYTAIKNQNIPHFSIRLFIFLAHSYFYVKLDYLAQIMNIPINTVKTKVHRQKNHFLTILK